MRNFDVSWLQSQRAYFAPIISDSNLLSFWGWSQDHYWIKSRVLAFRCTERWICRVNDVESVFFRFCDNLLKLFKSKRFLIAFNRKESGWEKVTKKSKWTTREFRRREYRVCSWVTLIDEWKSDDSLRKFISVGHHFHKLVAAGRVELVLFLGWGRHKWFVWKNI